MPFSQSYLVIGASRIIGKDLVIQLTAKSSNKVFATVRKPTSDCEHLPNVTLLTLDQGNTKSVNAAALRLTEPVDTLIINAAIGDDEKVLTTSEDRWQEYYDTNILGPFRVVKAFLPHLRKGTAKKIIVMSSTAGSLMKQINMDFGFLGPYAVTKVSIHSSIVARDLVARDLVARDLVARDLVARDLVANIVVILSGKQYVRNSVTQRAPRVRRVYRRSPTPQMVCYRYG
ncbi:hypothetical protein H2198_007912 [Neophaeococcomyces mojaviensis]|uniref:Uncharacterized protein n=1 Tax=Neophaeococcomyces mojaviensis TaxID=3383035 RepID=A0ACC2ZZ27_9EURO|nr:hypothetical protein H2198_007912 [Knufia sp. JES_112]